MSADRWVMVPDCSCRRCIAERNDTVNGLPRLLTEMIVCRHCGDKRCQHAHDHSAPCAKVDLYAHNAWVERAMLAAAPAAPAAQSREPLTEEQIEQGRRLIFSTNNPFCPCDDKTMLKAVRWAERAHGIGGKA